VRKGLIGKIGENMSSAASSALPRAQQAGLYLHGSRIGVCRVRRRRSGCQGRGHARGRHEARGPVQRRRAGRPDRKRALRWRLPRRPKTAAEAAGKPVQSDEIVAKRIEGGVQKYLKEVSLFNQVFVKNDKQTVEQMLKATNTTVKGFTLYVVGEGIEKKVDDFAAEVAAQVAAAKARPDDRPPAGPG
jgi:elongation factor Ts